MHLKYNKQKTVNSYSETLKDTRNILKMQTKVKNNIRNTIYIYTH